MREPYRAICRWHEKNHRRDFAIGIEFQYGRTWNHGSGYRGMQREASRRKHYKHILCWPIFQCTWQFKLWHWNDRNFALRLPFRLRARLKSAAHPVIAVRAVEAKAPNPNVQRTLRARKLRPLRSKQVLATFKTHSKRKSKPNQTDNTALIWWVISPIYFPSELNYAFFRHYFWNRYGGIKKCDWCGRENHH